MRRILATLVLALGLVGAAEERPKVFRPKGKPQPGDWLLVFPEPGQSFQQYVDARPVRAAEGDVLRFVPIGPFTKDERALLERTAELARIWYRMDVEIAKPIELPKEGWQRERTAGRQYHTKYFLEHALPPLRTGKALSVFGITMADLYPDPRWNFVFGEASLRGRVGVWSFARLGSASDDERLRRCFKLVSHEIGHTFGLEHCIRFECNMNGSNSLPEMDRQPLHFCPHCLRKLRWNRGFRHAERYSDLQAFYRRAGLDEDGRWVTSAIAYLETFRSGK